MSSQKIYATFSFFKLAAALSAVAIALLAAAEYTVFPGALLPGLALIGLVFILLGFRLIQLIYKLQLDRAQDVNQIESLLWLYQQFVPRRPLPPLRGYAGSPDFLKILAEACLQHQPKVIVEAGSGVSSIIIAELLHSQGSDAAHFALDHLERYASETAAQLDNPGSKALFAPLKDYEIEGKVWKWYDFNALPTNLDPIDLLVIDGPPEDLQPLARFPALPLLWERLSPTAVIILDDAVRKDEQRIVELWKKAYKLEARYLPTEKGTIILRRKGGP